MGVELVERVACPRSDDLHSFLPLGNEPRNESVGTTELVVWREESIVKQTQPVSEIFN